MKSKQWISIRESGRRMEKSPTVVARMIRSGLLTTRCFPGGRPQVRAEDIERLAAIAVRPAASAQTSNKSGTKP